MKGKKLFLSIVILCLILFVGCSNNNDAESTESDDPEVSTESEAEEVADTVDYEAVNGEYEILLNELLSNMSGDGSEDLYAVDSNNDSNAEAIIYYNAFASRNLVILSQKGDKVYQLDASDDINLFGDHVGVQYVYTSEQNDTIIVKYFVDDTAYTEVYKFENGEYAHDNSYSEDFYLDYKDSYLDDLGTNYTCVAFDGDHVIYSIDDVRQYLNQYNIYL